MEGIDQLVTMTTKWIHAFEFIIAFERVSERLNGRHPDHAKLRQRLLHHFSLMCSVALSGLTAGDYCEIDWEKLQPVHPEREDLQWRGRLLTGAKQGKMSAMLSSGDFHIFNPVTDEEKYELTLASDRTALISMWICEDLARAVRTKLISTPAPIVARAYQEVSNGMLGLNQAAKILVIQFPFPFAQMLSLMTILFTITTPFIVAFFTIDKWFAFLMIATLGIGYYGCNEIAKEIEEPYGSDKNDLPLDYLQQDFVDSLQQVYMASCAPLPDTYDGLVPAHEVATRDEPKQVPKDFPGGRHPADVQRELKRFGLAPFPTTFAKEDILNFPLEAWCTKAGDGDLGQYLYLWVRTQ